MNQLLLFCLKEDCSIVIKPATNDRIRITVANIEHRIGVETFVTKELAENAAPDSLAVAIDEAIIQAYLKRRYPAKVETIEPTDEQEA